MIIKDILDKVDRFSEQRYKKMERQRTEWTIFLGGIGKTEAGGWTFGPGLLLFLGVNADFFWRLCCP